MRGRTADIAFVAALVVIGGVYFQAIYRPAARSVRSQSLRLLTTRAEIVKSDDFTSGLEDLERYLREFQEAIADLDRLVPSHIDGDDRLREINGVVQACGLKSRSIRPDPAVPFGPVTAHPLTITVSGTYEQILGFLFQAEALPRLTRATQVSVEHDLEQSHALRAQIELTTFSVGADGGEQS